MSTSSATETFWQLITRRHITVPPIQRDYVQGRPSERAKAVRMEFARSLVEAVRGDSGKGLHLDFIYGTGHGDRLRPIDGQQRLTTLFLLHWVLAARSGLLSDSSDSEIREVFTRFSYDQRTAATEFLRQLTGWTVPSVACSTTKEDRLSDVIADQMWFSGIWFNDPTVSGMMAMIEAIDEQLCSAEHRSNPAMFRRWWTRLTENENKCVTFSVLAVEELTPENPFGDDIYLKMNARGKALTEWEQFKNWFEEYVVSLSMSQDIPEDWQVAIDTRWTDLFWHYRDGENALVDEEMLRFFRMVAAIGVAKERANIVQELFSDKFLPVSWYRDQEVFDPATIALTFRLLKRMSWRSPEQEWGISVLNKAITGDLDRETAGNWFFLEDDLLGTLVAHYRDNKATDGPTLTNRLHIAAFLLVVDRIGPYQDEALRGWMRLFRNVIENLDRNRSVDSDEWVRIVRVFQESIGEDSDGDSAPVDPYSAWDDSLWSRLKALPRSFHRQIDEEQEKARLENDPADGPEWRALFGQYENGGFFRGRVLFARKLAPTGSVPETQRVLGFLAYVFSGPEGTPHWKPTGDTRYANVDNPDTSAFLFRRALLVHGDFSFYESGNWCLVENSSDYLSRRQQWFTEVLEPTDPGNAQGRGGPALRGLLEATRVVGIDGDFKPETVDGNLAREIERAATTMAGQGTSTSDARWRTVVAQCPRCLWYARGNNLRWNTEPGDGPIWVLKGKRVSGVYVELITYYLYARLCGPVSQPKTPVLRYREKTRQNPTPKIVWRYGKEAPPLIEACVDVASPGFVTVHVTKESNEERDRMIGLVKGLFGLDSKIPDTDGFFRLPVNTYGDVASLEEPFRKLTKFFEPEAGGDACSS